MLITTLALVLSVCTAQDEPLPPKPTIVLGSDAPKLELQEFVKGKPVKNLEKGTVYVLEFWATWCGPCIESMPHLSQLQQEFPAVTFIGVATDDPESVRDWVKENGKAANYRLAIESQNRDGEGKMSANWLTAAGQDGIPATFVVDKNGKIAWIGHPAELERPLAQIVSGKWNLQARAEEYQQAINDRYAAEDLKRKLSGLVRELETALLSGEDKQVESLTAAIEEMNPQIRTSLGFFKLQALASSRGDLAKAERLAKQLLAEHKDDPGSLLQLTLLLCPPRKLLLSMSDDIIPQPSPALRRIGLEAAEKVVEITKTDEQAIRPNALAMLAEAQAYNGRFGEAIQSLTEAIATLPKSELADAKPELDEMLARYKREAEKKRVAEAKAAAEKSGKSGATEKTTGSEKPSTGDKKVAPPAKSGKGR